MIIDNSFKIIDAGENIHIEFDLPKEPKNYLAQIGLETDCTITWKDSLLERPQEAKAGDFVKVWDNKEEPPDEDAMYGYIEDISEGAMYPYFIKNDYHRYQHIRIFNPPTRI